MNEITRRVHECNQRRVYDEPVLQLTFFVAQDVVTFSVSGDPDAEPDFEE
ncbi:MAG: hypothetical protein IJ308_08760 [Clostridia bacterium]|nr:hypothetical protein [Clostridia bacterium]